jgi:phage/plasmid-like protein (TIGR03299 family)
MSANVETMFSVREKPWHGLGKIVSEAPTSADALRLAGLDWNVVQKDVYTDDGFIIPGYRVNMRDSDNTALGIVSDRYRIVQNSEAFSFTDSLIGGEVRYETAGSLKHGKKIWLLAKLPDREIIGDKTETYMCFTNSHDGTGAVQVCMTPVRVVCNNTLNLALRTAKRNWSIVHKGNIQAKIEEARMCLEMADSYMDKLNVEAEKFANVKVTNDQMNDYLVDLFPITDDMSDTMKKRRLDARNDFMVCFMAPDLEKFANTGWAAINAASDFASHREPDRKTKNYQENNFGRILMGHALVDSVTALVGAGVKD